MLPFICRKRSKSPFWIASTFISFFSKYSQQWISKIRRDPGPDFVINTNTKVCSEHFTADDYSGKDPEAARRILKKIAVPSLFPWNSDKGFQRATRNSNKTDSARLSETSQQHCMELVSAEGMNETQDIGVEEVEFSGSDLIEFLQGKLEEMSLQLEELQTKHEKSLFRLENIKGVIIIKSPVYQLSRLRHSSSLL